MYLIDGLSFSLSLSPPPHPLILSPLSQPYLIISLYSAHTLWQIACSRLQTSVNPLTRLSDTSYQLKQIRKCVRTYYLNDLIKISTYINLPFFYCVNWISRFILFVRR